MVGAAYADFTRNGRIEWFELICSGAYAGPTTAGTHDVFLTAGHCVMPLVTFGGITDFWVSFDGNPRDNGGSPEHLIRANGFAWDPRFGHDLGNWYDSAVLLLPIGSVTGISPVRLPPAGYLDELKDAGTLQHSVFELVGYGVVPVWQQPGGTRFFVDGLRRTSLSQVKGLTLAWLLFNQNEHATDQGGLCFGDSGSPQFVPGTDMIVSTTTGRRSELPSEQLQLPARHGRSPRVSRTVPDAALSKPRRPSRRLTCAWFNGRDIIKGPLRSDLGSPWEGRPPGLPRLNTERYRSGRNGGASKASCRVTGTWVRIPPSPIPTPLPSRLSSLTFQNARWRQNLTPVSRFGGEPLKVGPTRA